MFVVAAKLGFFQATGPFIAITEAVVSDSSIAEQNVLIPYIIHIFRCGTRSLKW